VFLQKISLQNFRNYKKKEFSFSSKNTLIVGPNAIGKTNILEAIYLLARGKSFRADLEKEMISYGEEVGRVEGVILEEEGARDHFSKSLLRDSVGNLSHKLTGPNANIFSQDRFAPSLVKAHKIGQLPLAPVKLEVILTGGQVQGKKTVGKLFKVNGVGRRWRDFVGNLKVVLFRPEDINIILGSPSVRREWLDSILEQVDLDYRRCNLVYKKGLRQRNKLLDRIREGQAQPTQLEYWNRLLIKNGQIITDKRQELITTFNDQFSIFKEKFGNLVIEYDRSSISPERLERYAQAELALGATLVGPHRDDLRFKIHDLRIDRKEELKFFGSRGEQRMTILALKLAELNFISRKNNNNPPLMLLDDIFSELDYQHRDEVLSLIDGQQTIITSTETNFVSSKFLAKMEIVEI
jgi:DNA replication and repair protein RecF